MKKVVDISIGSVKFTLEEDAYSCLKDYLKSFEATIENPADVREVMQEVECRVAEIFTKEQKFPNQVIDIEKVRIVINYLGVIEYTTDTNSNYKSDTQSEKFQSPEREKSCKKLFRDTEDVKIAGVCSGLAYYLKVDPTIIRIILLVLFCTFGVGLVPYVILWIAVPKAQTTAQLLQMKGYKPTAENIKNYSSFQNL